MSPRRSVLGLMLVTTFAAACAPIVVRTSTNASREGMTTLAVGALRSGCRVQSAVDLILAKCGGGALDPATRLRDRQDAWLDIQFEADGANAPMRATCTGSEKDKCADWAAKIAEAGAAPPQGVAGAGPHAGAPDITESGVGAARLGMTREKAAAALGAPDDVERKKMTGTLFAETHHYRAKGLSLNYGVAGNSLIQIIVHGEAAEPGGAASGRFTPYVGSTSHGVSVDSTLVDVIARMGAPRHATPTEATYVLGKSATLVIAFDIGGRITDMRLVFTV